MKKRIPALILALCLALAPAGCGRQEKPDTQPSSIELGSSQPEDRQPPAPKERRELEDRMPYRRRKYYRGKPKPPQ